MNGTVDVEDADLKRAIALSLQASSNNKDAIVISDSSDDDGRPAASSKQEKRKRDDDVEHDSSATELSDDEEVQELGNLRAAGPSSSTRATPKRTASADPASVVTKKSRQDTAIQCSSKVAENGSTASGSASNRTLPASAPVFAGIDRAAMERERLARQAAREAANPSASSSSTSSTSTSVPVLPPFTTAISFDFNDNDDDNAGVASQALAFAKNGNPTAQRKARFATLATLAAKQGDTRLSSSSSKGKERQRDDEIPTNTSKSSSNSNSDKRFGTFAELKAREYDRKGKFWKGIVRPTASSRHSGYECFTFADVLGNTDDLESALLTTFCGEPEWIHSQFPSSTKIVLVMPCAKDGNFMEVKVAPNMKLINPKREQAGRGVMHIKLMLLYYKTFLRVAVSTANFIQYDWSTIENAVYVHDFPKFKEPTEVLPTPPFLDTLFRVHRSLGTPQAYYKTALTNYDYDSAHDRVRLVLSVPGTHTGSRALFDNGGHIALCKALNDLHLATPFKGAKLSLECQGSSIGSYTSDWMKSFHRSALGWYPAKNSVFKNEESARKKYAYNGTGDWPEELKIVYPTFKTVKESLGGPGGGGTIFCPLETWKKASFPRQLFYDSKSQREGLLQHTKMILGIVKPADPPPATPFSAKRYDKDTSQPIKPFGWLYIGSHNFTPAAWGRYSEKSGSLSLANHELGVVVSLGDEDVEAQASKLVTWKRPLVKYGKDDTPWDQFKYGK